jgi:nucleoside-diphosphate-sugar epimerase
VSERTIVVTGANGFIGRALCGELEREGARVLRASRGAVLPRSPEACCVHLAGSNDPARAAADETGSRREAEELAGRVLSAGYARAILASTSHIYGDVDATPHREDFPPAPTSAYARVKLALETMFRAAGQTVARLSNVYGPGQPEINVVADIMRQLPGDGIIRLRGSAEAIRDYLFIEDAAKGLARLALSEEAGIFNFSTGRGTSVAGLTEILARLRGLPKPRIESGASRAPSTLILDPGLAHKRLGWRAQTSLEEGLKPLLAPVKS